MPAPRQSTGPALYSALSAAWGRISAGQSSATACLVGASVLGGAIVVAARRRATAAGGVVRQCTQRNRECTSRRHVEGGPIEGPYVCTPGLGECGGAGVVCPSVDMFGWWGAVIPTM